MVRVYIESLLSLLFAVLIIASSEVVAEKRIALVVGNADYKNASLNNPLNDATDMAEALKNTGFEVDIHINANRKQMRQAIRSFGDKLARADVGLFYFAGHGLQIKGRNYLIPIGADVHAADEVQDESIDASAVLRKMESAGNSVNIVILDACRNNPFARSFRSLDSGLARMDGPVGSFIAYATAPGSVAADGEGRNGLYTEYLLKALNKPDLTIEQTFKQVRTGVIKVTSGQQVPWESSSLTGEFVFLSSPSQIKQKALSQSSPVNQVVMQQVKHLQLSSNVPDAVVIVNNINRGLIKNTGILGVESLSDGKVDIVVQARGYQSQRRQISLNSNQTEKVHIELVPEQAIKTINTTKGIDPSLPGSVASCLAGKRFLTTNKIVFQNIQGKNIRRRVPSIETAVIKALQSANIEFIDKTLLSSKALKQGGFEDFNLDELATRHQLNYLLRIMVNVREMPIKIIKTEMKTVNGEITVDLVDLKSKLLLGSVSRDFNKAGLDSMRVVNKQLKKLLPDMSSELIETVCDSISQSLQH